MRKNFDQHGREYRVYEMDNTVNDHQKPTNYFQEGYYMPRPTLTDASREFARAALEYAQANDMDYPSAVKELMRAGSAKRYEAQPASPAELHPYAVKQAANQWLVEQGNGEQLLKAIRENPDVAHARHSGILNESAARKIFNKN